MYDTHFSFARASSEKLVDWCANARRRPRSLQLRLYLSGAEFRELRGERELGFSSLRDYAANRHGTPPASFHAWIRRGVLLRESPALRTQFLEGRLGNSHLDELAALPVAELSPGLVQAAADLPVEALRESLRALRAPAPAAAESPPDDRTDGADAGGERWEPVRLRVPCMFAPYFRESLALAAAMLGGDVDDESRLLAVLAEASTEIPIEISGAQARALFTSALTRVSSTARRRPPQAPARRPLSPVEPETGHRRSTAERSDRARELDIEMRRLLKSLQRIEARRDDQLLQLLEARAHHRLGFRRFDEFADEHLSIAPSTTWERIARARKQRRRYPIAVAHARGELSALQATLLFQLERLHVPRSCLQSWIDECAPLTIRALRDRIAWARAQVERDYRAWCLAGCPPPSDDELRTSRRRLLQIARDPAPESILQLRGSPENAWTTLEWVLETETVAFLAQLIVSVQRRIRAQNGIHIAPWQALLMIFRCARESWSAIDSQRRHPFEHCLDRDEYRCAVPACSRRRGLEAHHIRFRSRGGGNESENIITLCAFHHRQQLHEGRLHVSGRVHNGAEDLLWEMGVSTDGRPHLVYRGDRLIREPRRHRAPHAPPLLPSPEWSRLGPRQFPRRDLGASPRPAPSTRVPIGV